ncbi:MAG: flippase-like domain-containing protein [Clostridia bacterium]|nr:flippase-like domain-containing protein [Clostridia bacterium]
MNLKRKRKHNSQEDCQNEQKPLIIPVQDENVLENQISIEEVLAGVDFAKNVNENIDSIVDVEHQAKALQEANEKVVKQKSPQKKIWSFIFLIINIVIVVIILLQMLEGQNVTPFYELEFNAVFLILAILIFPALMMCDQIRYNMLITQSTKRHRPFLAYKVAGIGRYYDYITPLASGGQAFQIYYLTSRGVKASKAISIPLARYIIQQIVFAFIALFLLIGSLTFLKETFTSATGSTLVSVASWIGFTINFFVIFATIILSSSRLGHKVVIGILKFLKKIKIVRNYDKYYNKLIKLVEEYQRTMKFFAKSPKLLFSMIFFSVLVLLLQYTAPFLIYCALGGEPSVDIWIQIMIVSLMIDLACSFVPLPGGSGAAEISFAAMFSSLFSSGTFWAMLFWRFITYYAFVLQGLGIIIYDYAIGNKKNQRLLERWRQEEENLNRK